MTKNLTAPTVTTIYEVEFPLAITTVEQALNGPWTNVDQYTSLENAEKRHAELLQATVPHLKGRPDLIVLRHIVVVPPVVTVLRQGNWRNEEVA
jgi:hypothetical protein